MSLSSLAPNPKKVTYEGKDRDESIVYIVRSSIITLIPATILTLTIIIASFFFRSFLQNFGSETGILVRPQILPLVHFFLITLAFGVYLHSLLNWYFNVLVLSNKKILDIDFVGLSYKNVSETTIEHVEDVTSTVSGLWGLLFNIGNINVQTAGEQREFEFYNVDDPSKVRDLIADFAAKIRKRGNRGYS